MRRKPKNMIEAIRDLCPTKGSSISSITISCNGKEIATLTAETRDKINKMNKRINEHSADFRREPPTEVDKP